MANPYVNMSHVTKITLHEGWLEHKSFHDYKWKKSWLTLQGNDVYFFNSQNTSEESPTGILQIDKDFKFLKKNRSSEKTGYKFELHTSRSVIKFKACKFSERELWRAYLEGIATGQVSESIDLPPEILVQIRLLLQAQRVDTRRSSLSDPGQRDSTASIPDIPPHEDDDSGFSNDGLSADSGCVDDFYLEPTNSQLLNYVFYNNHHKKELPSWFFQNCTRDKAEEILTKGYIFGNTLMRKGTAHTSNLVISKKVDARKEDFNHFVIDIQPHGYKLLVENPHQPMKCLTDIMNFFVQTSGASTTIPMTCNDLQKMGVSPEHIYNPVILPNPSPEAIEKKADKHGYQNEPSRHDISKAWMKHRSQSSPNIMPLMDLRSEVRRSSLATEAEPLSPTTKQTRFVHTARPLPPPPPSDIPLPPPPPPPANPPPKLPSNTTNRSRVNNITAPPPLPPPSSDAPPLPGHHPSPRRTQLGSTLSIVSQFEDNTHKKHNPPVAPRPIKRVDESQNGKTIGDVPEEEFKKRLEMMFGDGSKSKTMPAIKPSKKTPPGPPNLKTVTVTPTVSSATNQDFSDVVYDDLDGYQNTATIINIRNK